MIFRVNLNKDQSLDTLSNFFLLGYYKCFYISTYPNIFLYEKLAKKKKKSSPLFKDTKEKDTLIIYYFKKAYKKRKSL